MAIDYRGSPPVRARRVDAWISDLEAAQVSIEARDPDDPLFPYAVEGEDSPPKACTDRTAS